MTEDDTFRILSRISVQEMAKIYLLWMAENPGFTIVERSTFFANQNWGVREFVTEYRRVNGTELHD